VDRAPLRRAVEHARGVLSASATTLAAFPPSSMSPQVSKETIKLLDTRGQHTGDMEFAVDVSP
jgi:hypothetical protein